MNRVENIVSAGLCCAALSCAFPLALGFGFARYASFLLSSAWLFLLVYGLAKYRMQGWRIILGLPFAILWPGAFLIIKYGCFDCLKK